jgi:hypothetical protein
MTEEPEQKDVSEKDSSAPVDEIRAKFLAALAKKQGGQGGAPGAQKGGKSSGPNSSDGHGPRHFQRKSGAS